MKKLMIILIISLIIILLTNIPVFAEENGIHGETALRYELISDWAGQFWKIDLHYNFNEMLTIGFTETTYTNGFGTYFDIVSYNFYPENLFQEIYLQINIVENLSIKICKWRNYPVNYGFLIIDVVPEGLYIESNYKF